MGKLHGNASFDMPVKAKKVPPLVPMGNFAKRGKALEDGVGLVVSLIGQALTRLHVVPKINPGQGVFFAPRYLLE
jgi:hypothetical protein